MENINNITNIYPLGGEDIQLLPQQTSGEKKCIMLKIKYNIIKIYEKIRFNRCRYHMVTVKEQNDKQNINTNININIANEILEMKQELNNINTNIEKIFKLLETLEVTD